LHIHNSRANGWRISRSAERCRLDARVSPLLSMGDKDMMFQHVMLRRAEDSLHNP